MYYSPLFTRLLWNVSTADSRARDEEPSAEVFAHANVSSHGDRGGYSNGFQGDVNGYAYQLMPSQNVIYYFDLSNGLDMPFSRDPRIPWPDVGSVGTDAYFQISINQWPCQPDCKMELTTSGRGIEDEVSKWRE